MHNKECTLQILCLLCCILHYHKSFPLQFLYNNRKEGCTTSAINCATKNGHLDIVNFLQSHPEIIH